MQRLEIEEMQRTLMENLKKKLYKSEKRIEKKLRVLEIALSWNVGHERERERERDLRKWVNPRNAKNQRFLGHDRVVLV